ncbi:MAG: hypothetical protein M3Y80_07545 [Verrucomicrobiota bacterium]|nr:hypothetical protein [Verrucomicrobiota bacterium]
MFVIDFLTAFVLSVAMTLLFAALFRRNGYRRFGDITGLFALVVFASWAGGIWLTAFGPVLTATHWVPFGIAVVALLITAALVARSRAFRSDINPPDGRPGGVMRSATTAYFIITLLVFFSAVSLRFYVAHT